QRAALHLQGGIVATVVANRRACAADQGHVLVVDRSVFRTAVADDANGVVAGRLRRCQARVDLVDGVGERLAIVATVAVVAVDVDDVLHALVLRRGAVGEVADLGRAVVVGDAGAADVVGGIAGGRAGAVGGG